MNSESAPDDRNDSASFDDRFGNLASGGGGAYSALLRALERHREGRLRYAEQEAAASPFERGTIGAPFVSANNAGYVGGLLGALAEALSTQESSELAASRETAASKEVYGKPVRRLGVRIDDPSAATVFDSGASAVPFVPRGLLPVSGRPATFDERFPVSLAPTGAQPGAASSDDLEAFRRQWFKAFMEP